MADTSASLMKTRVLIIVAFKVKNEKHSLNLLIKLLNSSNLAIHVISSPIDF